MRVLALHVYPLKGAKGVAVESARVLFGGLEHDRRFMLVDDEGRFVSQRGTPRLALVHATIDGESLVIEGIRVPLAADGPRRTVSIWKDEVLATEASPEASAMLSDFLGEHVTLVHMPNDIVRPVDPTYARPGDRVGFADGFPVLVASSASLAALNAELEAPVPMNRFRPNVVLEGGAPWEEDAHPGVRIGPLSFRTPKRCARCSVTTVDQATAERGKEPLRTLTAMPGRTREDGGICFAMNAIPDAEGTLRIGDPAAFLS